MSIVSRVRSMGDDNYELGGHWDESVNGLNDDAATDHTNPQTQEFKVRAPTKELYSPSRRGSVFARVVLQLGQLPDLQGMRL